MSPLIHPGSRPWTFSRTRPRWPSRPRPLWSSRAVRPQRAVFECRPFSFCSFGACTLRRSGLQPLQFAESGLEQDDLPVMNHVGVSVCVCVSNLVTKGQSCFNTVDANLRKAGDRGTMQTPLLITLRDEPARERPPELPVKPSCFMLAEHVHRSRENEPLESR